MNKERLLKLADTVEKGYYKFNGIQAALVMSTWFENYSMDTAFKIPEHYPERKDLQVEDAFKCNSMACIAGFACLLFDYENASTRRHYNHEAVAAELLGLEAENASDLFCDYTSPNVTGADAAVVIRRLVETGEVDWSITTVYA